MTDIAFNYRDYVRFFYAGFFSLGHWLYCKLRAKKTIQLAQFRALNVYRPIGVNWWQNKNNVERNISHVYIHVHDLYIYVFWHEHSKKHNKSHTKIDLLSLSDLTYMECIIWWSDKAHRGTFVLGVKKSCLFPLTWPTLSFVPTLNFILVFVDDFRAKIWFSVRERYVSRSNLLFSVYIYMLSYSMLICVTSMSYLWCSVLTFIID